MTSLLCKVPCTSGSYTTGVSTRLIPGFVLIYPLDAPVMRQRRLVSVLTGDVDNSRDNRSITYRQVQQLYVAGFQAFSNLQQCNYVQGRRLDEVFGRRHLRSEVSVIYREEWCQGAGNGKRTLSRPDLFLTHFLRSVIQFSPQWSQSPTHAPPTRRRRRERARRVSFVVRERANALSILQTGHHSLLVRDASAKAKNV